jgi:hypothetical protein
MKMNLVAQFVNSLLRKFFIADFGFLKTNKIRVQLVYYRFELVQPGTNAVDVKGHKHHECRFS